MPRTEPQRVSGLRLCSALSPSLRKFVDIPWDSGSTEPQISYSPRPAHDFGWWKYAPRFHRNGSCCFPIMTILTVYRPGPRFSEHTNNGSVIWGQSLRDAVDLSYLMGLYPCPRSAACRTQRHHHTTPEHPPHTELNPRADPSALQITTMKDG